MIHMTNVAAIPAPPDRDLSHQIVDEVQPLRDAAKSFEAVFLAEMFAHAGLGAPRESQGGGVGEEAFASLLAREWADAVADSGGIGLVEQIFRALEMQAGA